MRILLLGNQHTTNHEFPQILEALIREGDHIEVEVKSQASHGADLSWHWNSLSTRELISKGGWDYVIFQGCAEEALENRAHLLETGESLAAEVRRHGSATEVVFMVPWAPYGFTNSQDAINDAYEELAAKTDGHLAPVGEAWRSFVQSYPELPLHEEDRHHSRPRGSYLSACVLFRYLTGHDPRGIPTRLQQQGQPLVSIEETEASKLQEVAEAVMEELWP